MIIKTQQLNYFINKRDFLANFLVSKQLFCPLNGPVGPSMHIGESQMVPLSPNGSQTLLSIECWYKTAIWINLAKKKEDPFVHSTGPFGSTKAYYRIQKGKNLCWTIYDDRKTAIWLTLDTTETILKTLLAKKRHIIGFRRVKTFVKQ